MTTPPGWYPDPGQTGHGPALERWWDGSIWTDYTREPQGTAVSEIPAQQAGFGPPQHSGFPDTPLSPPPSYGLRPAESESRGRTMAIAGAAVVLVAAIVGGVVLLTSGGESSDIADARPSTGPQQPTPGAPGDGGAPSGAPSAPANTVQDATNGISVPVPQGWDKSRSSTGGAGLTIGPYPCPGERDTTCARGGVFTREANGYEATTAEGVAKEDIAKNTESSYGKDPRTGKQMYGGVVSHRQVRAEAVTVAGQQGYLVRWKVTTKKGDGGVVQSLAFPAPNGGKTLVLVRFGFDAGGEAPPLTDMDAIAEGIAPLGAGGAGGSI
ncbi:DUF2510 domain-containing protein [Streptomyces sp. bgisy100]|uniref:DUF2510 domain-containing protein n=1 Tax=Streptomyces sp. bgisy100 TaxID=3413783 RepID=UPI003D75422B